VQDTADLGSIFFLHDLDDFFVGVTIVNNQRFARVFRQLDMPAESTPLLIARRMITVKVKAGFSDGDNLIHRFDHVG